MRLVLLLFLFRWSLVVTKVWAGAPSLWLSLLPLWLTVLPSFLPFFAPWRTIMQTHVHVMSTHYLRVRACPSRVALATSSIFHVC